MTEYVHRGAYPLIATALLAGADDDTAPVLNFPFQPFAAQADPAAFGEHRLDGGDAQFDGFLQGVIHLFAGLHGLNQRHRQGRLALHVTPCAQRSDHAILLDALDARLVLAGTTVEKYDRRSRREPQDTHRVACHRLRQIDVGAWREHLPAVEARLIHGVVLWANWNIGGNRWLP